MTNEQKNELKWGAAYFLMRVTFFIAHIVAIVLAFIISSPWALFLILEVPANYLSQVLIMRKYPELAEWWLTFHN